MKKNVWFSLLLVLLLALTACGTKEEASTTEKASGSEKKPAEELRIIHELGEAVIKPDPKTVVTFDFGVLDTLDELGVEVAGIPQAAIPPYLEKYKSADYKNVGSLKEPDYEAIAAMNPDVIFISGRQTDLYEEFAKIAPTVFVGLDYENYMDSLTKNMEMVAKIFGKEAEMKKELEEVQAAVEEIKEKTASKEEKALVILGGESEVSAYGPGSRFGLIHDVFGFKAVDEKLEKSTHGQSITFEYIAEKNPDILFVVDQPAAFNPEASSKKTIENDLTKKTNAYKNGKVIYLNGGNWYLSGGGLQSLKLMIQDIESGL